VRDRRLADNHRLKFVFGGCPLMIAMTAVQFFRIDVAIFLAQRPGDSLQFNTDYRFA
jgi:hypothetical protein